MPHYCLKQSNSNNCHLRKIQYIDLWSPLNNFNLILYFTFNRPHDLKLKALKTVTMTDGRTDRQTVRRYEQTSVLNTNCCISVLHVMQVVSSCQIQLSIKFVFFFRKFVFFSSCTDLTFRPEII